jgi:beta-carotene 3-hydroxylase
MTLLVVVATFVIMEPVTYAVHRWVMHGPGRRLHLTHHRRDREGFELNDWFPVLFSMLGMLAFAAGASIGPLAVLVPVSLGSAAYGAAYVFVHDVYIHRRLPWFTATWAPLERLKAAHRVHHLWNGEPYGMLVPLVPADLRRRATSVANDPFPPARRPVKGSRPLQVPVEA